VISNRSEELYAFYARHFTEHVDKRPASTNGHNSELTDEEVIRLARSAKNAANFEPLWLGDTRGYSSPSEADQALISRLAFYAQDEEQLDRLYRQSGLCRQKWLDRPDYRRRTITRALSNLTETYTPDDGARMVVSGNGGVSQRPNPNRDGTRDTEPEVVRLADVERPGPRRYHCQDLVLAAYVTLLHGDGGVAKSLLALALAVAVAGNSREWLGQRVENGRVLYLDFELPGGG
jgi:putative DNA primase/helicase